MGFSVPAVIPLAQPEEENADKTFEAGVFQKEGRVGIEQILCLTLVMFVGLVFTWDSVAIGEVIELQSCPGNMKVGDSSE